MILLKVRRTASEPEPYVASVNGQDLVSINTLEPMRFKTCEEARRAALREAVLRETAAAV